MLPKKSSLTLSAAVITVLASSSYATLATDLPPPENLTKGVGLPEKKRSSVGDSWMKNRQKTSAEEAAEKKRAERDAELEAIRQAKRETEVKSAEPEKKPAEAPELAPSPKKETSSPAPVPAEKPASKPRLTLHEQIQLHKQKKAEELLRHQQMNKGKADVKPVERSTTLSHEKNRQTPRIQEMIKQQAQEEAAATKTPPSAAQPATPPLPKPAPTTASPKPTGASRGITEEGKPAAQPASPPTLLPKPAPTSQNTEPMPAQKPAAHEETKAGIPIPPPAPAATGTGEKATPSRSSLLEKIRKGKELKHLDAPQR